MPRETFRLQIPAAGKSDPGNGQNMKTSTNTDETIRRYCLQLYGRLERFLTDDDPSHWELINARIIEEETDRAYEKLNRDRIEEISAMLRDFCIPGPEDSVLDLGCGTGRLTKVFARSAGQVTALDFSGKMLKKAEENIGTEYLSKVELISRDIRCLDPEKEGWIGKFDLVAAVLVPQCQRLETIRQMESMSRKYCFLEIMLSYTEETLDEIVVQLLGKENYFKPDRIRLFQILYNILCLDGRFPAIRYRRSEHPVEYADEERCLDRISERIINPGKTEHHKIEELKDRLRALKDENGVIKTTRKYLFGDILWDVRDGGSLPGYG